MCQYVIGIDGGGTGSKGVVADLLGNVLVRVKSGPINYVGNEKEVIDRNYAALFKDALMGRDISNCAAICIGSAGVSNHKSIENIEKILKETGFTCPHLITTDSHSAHAGALDGNEGIVVIAGTGAICLGRKNGGENLRVGGYGHLIDDEGSAYDIGKQMLRAIVRAEDGRGEQTCLKELVYKQLGIGTVSELISWLYAPGRPKGDIAALSVLIEEADKKNDSVADQIERNAARELVVLCKPALAIFDNKTTIALSGSVLQKNAKVRQYFIEEIQDLYPENFGTDDGIRVVIASHEADYGAMIIALNMID